MSADGELAKDLSIQQLHGIRTGNVPRFEALNWTGTSAEILVEFFPLDVKYGKLHPPATYLTCADIVRKWRKLGKGDQIHAILVAEEEREKEEKRSARRGGSRRRSRDEIISAEPTEQQQQQVTTPPNFISTTKKRKRGEGDEGGGVEDNEVVDDNLDRLVQSGQATPLLEFNQDMEVEDDDEEDEEERLRKVINNSTICHGISTFTIDDSNINDTDNVKTGFSHLVGNVFRFKANYLSNNQCQWPYGRDVAGFLINQTAKKDAEDDAKYSWKCVEVGDDANMVRVAFQFNGCSGKKAVGKQVCQTCWRKKYTLFNLCRNEVSQREKIQDDPILKGRNDYIQFRSPSIFLPHITAMAKQIKVLRSANWKKDRVIKALKAREVEVSNVDADYLFEEKVLRQGYEKMKSQIEVDERDILEILFQECMAVKKRIRAKGNAKGHLYSPLLIRFAIMLRNNLSQSKYEFFRRAFGLPTNATLCEYRSADTTAEDGLMHETCRQQAIAMHKLNVPRGDFRWHLAMSFDSHSIKEMLVFCHHTQRIVGYAHDAFEKDVIVEEFKRMAAADKTAEETANEPEEDDDNDEEEPAKKVRKTTKEKKTLALGKHYHAFVVQSITSNGTPVRFIAARYCVANMSHRWLRLKIEYIEAALAFYGFVVCAESFDGASENRSYVNNRATMTFRDLCQELLQSNPLDDELADNWDDLQRQASIALGEEMSEEDEEEQPQQMETDDGGDNETPSDVDMELDTEDMVHHHHYTDWDLPWGMKLGFAHPTIEGAVIIVAGDMGHGLKKKRNAMKHSGNEDKARHLLLNGLPISLRMAHDVWKLTPDGDPTNQSDIMFYPKLKKAVFVPTSKSSMSTSDAARAQGDTMRRMLEDYGGYNPKVSPRTYDSYILHCLMTDKWVNVMNASRSKYCELISAPNHRHIYDLCNYVKYLKEWKDSVADTNLFFPFSTYQDLVWTSLGPVALALYYLPNHPNHTINQMHLGSDPCETTFLQSRNANANASKRDTDNIMSNIHGGILNTMTASRKGNVGHKTTYYSNELLIGKIKRDSRKRNR